MPMDSSYLPPEMMICLALGVWVMTLIINICFAFAVYEDASKLPGRRKPIFVSPGIWFLATLYGGVFVAAAYWAMHHSRLSGAVPVAQAGS